MPIAETKVSVHKRAEDFVIRKLHDLGLGVASVPQGKSIGHIQALTPAGRRIANLLIAARTERAHQGWVMNQKHEFTAEERLFYALVDFEPRQPVTYIVPSSIISAWLKKDHADWLKEDTTHQDNPVRKLRSGRWLDQYREAWQLIQ